MPRRRWDADLQTWIEDQLGDDLVEWDEVADKPTLYPPMEHGHEFIDLPVGVQAFAIGTNTERPNAGFVLWLAAAEPPAMIDGDLVIINPIFG